MAETAVDFQNRIGSLKTCIANQKSNIEMLKGKRSETERVLLEEVTGKTESAKKKDLYEKTSLFLGSVLQDTQGFVEDCFSNIGTNALAKVFDKDISLQFKLNMIGKRPSLAINLEKPYEESTRLLIDPDDGGGGVIDVLAFSLRLAMMEFFSPLQDGPLFLDESFKFVAEENIDRVGSFIREISQTMDKQIVLITHSRRLASYADRTFEFRMAEGEISKISVTE